MEISISPAPNPGAKQVHLRDAHFLSEDIRACSILIIDDEPIICELIQLYLMDYDFLNIKIANDGLSGLNQIISDEPDLVILDIQMPKMNGIEVLKKIRAVPKFDDLPIIIETSHDKLEKRIELLRAGATNIISKPIDFDLLLFCMKNHLESRLVVKNLKRYQNRIVQELNAARTMQLQLLPHEEDIKRIEEQYGVKLDWYYSSSSELGGDWWGAHPINSHKFGVFVADFTGHGVVSAINTFRLHAIMGDIQPDPDSPGHYLQQINEHLTDRIPRGQFATMSYAIIDVKANSLVYASAGHTSPMFGNKYTKSLSIGDPIGTPLGIKKSIVYTNHQIPLNPGEFLFQYSDALTETPGEDTEPWGEEGLEATVRESLSLPTDERPLEWLLNKFYTRSPLPSDDVTALWLERQI